VGCSEGSGDDWEEVGVTAAGRGIAINFDCAVIGVSFDKKGDGGGRVSVEGDKEEEEVEVEVGKDGEMELKEEFEDW